MAFLGCVCAEALHQRWSHCRADADLGSTLFSPLPPKCRDCSLQLAFHWTAVLYSLNHAADKHTSVIAEHHLNQELTVLTILVCLWLRQALTMHPDLLGTHVRDLIHPVSVSDRVELEACASPPA